MDKTDLLVGLDIGTTSVKAVVADTASNEMQIIGAANGPTKGMRHGKILDIDQTAESISAVLKKVAQKTNSKIYRVVTGIPVGLLQLENAVSIAVTKTRFTSLSVTSLPFSSMLINPTAFSN